jgi:hypothetical protein
MRPIKSRPFPFLGPVLADSYGSFSSSFFSLHVKTKEFWPYRTRAPVVYVSNYSSRAERSHCSSDLGRISHSIRKGTKLFRQLFASELALTSLLCTSVAGQKRKKKRRQQSAAASKGLTPTVWVWNGSQKKCCYTPSRRQFQCRGYGRPCLRYRSGGVCPRVASPKSCAEETWHRGDTVRRTRPGSLPAE